MILELFIITLLTAPVIVAMVMAIWATIGLIKVNFE